MKKIFIAMAIAASSFDAMAYDQHEIAPREILEMDNLPNAGELFVEFCLVGHHLCQSHSTSCHGQCCSQYEADEIGYGCSGNIFGVQIPFSHYAGWHCQMYGTPVRGEEPNFKGDAGPLPKKIEFCHNLDRW